VKGAVNNVIWSVIKSTLKTYNDTLYTPLSSASAELSALYMADAGVIYFQNDQSVYLTSGSASLTLTGGFVTTGSVTVGTSLVPDAADGATIGSASAEWSDIYLADGGVIYFQNDQSVYLTPSASTLTLTGSFVATGSISTSAANDPYILLNETDGTDWYIGADDAGNSLEFRTNATVGNNVQLELEEDGDLVVTGDITVTGSDITLGVAGVKLTGDGDGAITFLGLGNGSDEDLTINLDDTADTVVFSSSTGVTALNFSALNLVTTGTVQAGIKISSDADGMDASAMTAAGMYGTMFIATGAGTWILPTAAVGMSACLMDSGTAHDLILDVTSGDTMRLKGTEGSDGVGITNASGTSKGDFVCVVAVAANKWSTVGMQGTWASQ
jgi:hypothetical protein